VFLACYLALAVLVMDMLLRTPRTTRVYDFPAYRPSGRQAVAAWDHAGNFILRGGYMQFDAVRKFLMSELGLFLQAIIGLVVLHYVCGFEVAVTIALAFIIAQVFKR
jgi:hypothetical protein